MHLVLKKNIFKIGLWRFGARQQLFLNISRPFLGCATRKKLVQPTIHHFIDVKISDACRAQATEK